MTAMASFPSGAEHHHTSMLTVLEGVHQGVSLPLDMAACSIGAGQQSDLVLGDPGVAELHVTLRLAARHVSVEALGGDVSVITANGRRVSVAQGSGYRARLPLQLMVGQARLALAAPGREGEVAAPPVWNGTLQWMMAILFMFICAGALAVLREEAAPVQAGLAREADAIRPVVDRPAPDAIRAELERDVQAAGLEGVSVTLQGGHLVARGSVAPEQQAQWAELQRAFDGRHGRHVPLHSEVSLREPFKQPRVRLQAVWFGANPYVIDAAGEHLYPGAALEDGWILQAIEADRLVLARGEERFAFTLDGPGTDEG
ncbi:SctD/MshK family protein [Stutzerimonas marianensis]